MPAPFELIAAPHTPCYPDGALRLGTIDAQAEFLLRHSVQGVFVCGTTGEGLSLTTAERMAVLERWVKVSAGKLKVLAHVGHSCQREAVELAEHAAKLGVAGVAALAPHFLKPATVQDLVDFLKPIATACGKVPLLYYDIPSLTNVRHSAARVMELALAQIPNFGGLKLTNPDLATLSECLSIAAGKVPVYFGQEELLLSALPLGVRHAVGSTFSMTSRLHLEIVASYDRGDMGTANDLQRQSLRVARVLESFGGPVRAGKAMMALLGLDVGPVRPPLSLLTGEEATRFAEDVANLKGLNR